MQVLTIKKPIYLGTAAQIIAAQAEAETRGSKLADRNRAARAAVGREYMGKSVRIVRIGGTRHVMVDDSDAIGVELEAEGFIRFADADGGIVVSLTEQKIPDPALV